MRNPTEVLKHLSEKSQEKEYRFERLYRNLYNPEFYWLAYRNLYANGGSMTPGVDGTTMDGMGQQRIDRLIQSLKDQSYQPKPARRTYIPKKSNPEKKRPLGIPSGDDKLVQEVIRMLLEAIYEPNFSKYSHGFRPARSCHTALLQIQKTYVGVTWFVEGDIAACFDSFDHHVLIDLLRKRIDDEKFISLMWKFLKAGYMEQWERHQTYSGTPQGSGMSPVLANIYLHELDTYMEEYRVTLSANNTRQRAQNPQYAKLDHQARVYKKKHMAQWATLSQEERKNHAKIVKGIKRQMRELPSKVARAASFKTLQYTRYADDFIIGVIGSKADAHKIKEDVRAFLAEKLHLTLSVEKTQVTHSTKLARFLGYDITITRDQSVKHQKGGAIRRVYNGKVKLYVPHEKWASKLQEYKAIRVSVDANGKNHWKAIHRGNLLNCSDIKILSRYNAEVRGMLNYYCIASNICTLHQFCGLMKHSMLRTFASKYRTIVAKIKTRYVRNGEFTVSYPTTKGMRQSVFYRGNYSRAKAPLTIQIDVLPPYKRYETANSLVARVKAKTCELCGDTDRELEMHQVKRLKDLRGWHPWEQLMLMKRRKTLAVCHACHEKIHNCDKNDRL